MDYFNNDLFVKKIKIRDKIEVIFIYALLQF